MGGLTIRIGLPPNVDQFRAAMAAAVKAAAVEAIKIIRLRTPRGRDVFGRVFPRYSERYYRAKRASGRRVSPPDLTLTGALLGGLEVLRAEPRRVVIGWKGNRHAVRFRKADVSNTASTGRKKLRGRKVPPRHRTVLETTPGKAVSYHDQVTGLERKFKFFAIVEPGELARLNKVAQRVLDREVKKVMAAARR